MQVNNVNRYNNPQFGAIFKLTKNTSSMSEIVIDSVKSCTVAEEAEKIANKFQIGGGTLFVYVPNARLQELQNLLHRRITSNTISEFITRID